MLGYFGHPNCSDNLTESMDKYGVQKQKGWHAINLFFNTSATGLNSVFLMNLLLDQEIM
jgi:aminomethyltransferase